MGRIIRMAFQLALGLGIVGVSTSLGLAQPNAGFQTRDWAGKAVDRACRASKTDLSGLHSALREHERARVGFDRKLDTGWYYGNALRDARLKVETQSPTSVLEKIKGNLRDLSREEPAAALIYDIGRQNNNLVICSWLITQEGIQAAENIKVRAGDPTSPGRLSQYAQNSLGVTAIQVSRSPRARGQPRAPAPDGALRSMQDARGSLDRVSSLLLPETMQVTVKDARIGRLLILPVADISTVPFYNLQVLDKTVLDYASIVVLGDTNGLFDHFAGPPVVERGKKLIVGNPDPTGDPLDWIDLTGAINEVSSINELAATMSGEMLIGKAATKAKVVEELARPSRHSLIYLATHGLADSRDPIDGSFLLLAGGRLNAKEIAKFPLGASPLVVMSACQSGLGKVFEGGMFGLARAWRKAGAPQVVMSLWDIDDDATSKLMTDFMQGVFKGRAPEFALRTAMLAARDERREMPGLYSGFAVFGFASR